MIFILALTNIQKKFEQYVDLGFVSEFLRPSWALNVGFTSSGVFFKSPHSKVLAWTK